LRRRPGGRGAGSHREGGCFHRNAAPGAQSWPATRPRHQQKQREYELKYAASHQHDEGQGAFQCPFQRPRFTFEIRDIVANHPAERPRRYASHRGGLCSFDTALES
jgi:hypothetical protein